MTTKADERGLGRKHGYKAKLAVRRDGSRRPPSRFDRSGTPAPETPGAGRMPEPLSLSIGGSRIKTSLTLARSQRAYLWFTDRGRSRVLLKF
ncbi:MAG: hypothetical protein HY927_05300 [Elusimicrobia bacterium]|nr:hypothetical protein [Elusimicrobiota bacterium]